MPLKDLSNWIFAPKIRCEGFELSGTAAFIAIENSYKDQGTQTWIEMRVLTTMMLLMKLSWTSTRLLWWAPLLWEPRRPKQCNTNLFKFSLLHNVNFHCCNKPPKYGVVSQNYIKIQIKGGVQRSVVDIPFASCAFPPTQFDSNLTRQLYNQAQGILSLFEISVIIVTLQPHARWLADGRIWELKHLVQSGHCANGSTTVHPGGTLRHLDLRILPRNVFEGGHMWLWLCRHVGPVSAVGLQ